VGGTDQQDTRKAFRLSVVFVAGSAVTFTALGVIASIAGRLIGTSASWWYIVLGVLMVLMALQTWGILKLSRPATSYQKTQSAAISAHLWPVF
jgi:thiol:disulfide interchange protein